MKPINRTIIFLTLLLIATLIIFRPHKVESEQERVIENIHPAVERDHAVDLAKSIALLETSGTLDCSIVGKNGEKGCHQYLPSTWASYSKEILGYVAPQTPQNAQKVTEGIIRKLIDQDLTDRQIFLTWNQGTPGPCRIGTNSKGVKYNSCAYAENGLAILQKVIHSNS